MHQRKRIYYSETQRSLMWDRWQRGEPLQQIADLFDRMVNRLAILTIGRSERVAKLCFQPQTAVSGTTLRCRKRARRSANLCCTFHHKLAKPANLCCQPLCVKA